MTQVKPRRPSGFNEYLPAEQLEFNRLLGIIRGTYEKYGFTPIDTPDIELTEVLLAKGGGETEQQVYTFAREGSNTSLTLRYDLTVPLARYVAEHESDLVFPFRRYHIGKVHRAERAQAGRFREFYQCDIDTVGSDSPLVDAEFPAIINEIFEAFNFGEFTIRINNRLILNGFFETVGLADVSREVLRIIDKMEKISEEAFRQELAALGLSGQQIDQVDGFTQITGPADEVLDRLSAIKNPSSQLVEGIEKMRVLVGALRTMGVPEHRFRIDLRIARGLDYYTGTVYETILNDYPQIGSVCSGGRYDDLASYYTKTRLPGVGISIGLTRLFYALQQVGAIASKRHTAADVIVIPLDTQQQSYGVEVATYLRSFGISVVLHSESGALSKRMRYASRIGVAYACVLGEEEAEARVIALKNMETQETTTVSFGDGSALEALFALS